MKRIPVGYIIIVAAAVIVFSYLIFQAYPNSVGPVGSTHIHADMKVYINGVAIDFSQPKYQLRTKEVHFEDGIGDVVHIHATGVTLNYVLNTLDMRLSDRCITVSKKGYCENGVSKLALMVQSADGPWITLEDPKNYLVKDEDRILISQGNPADIEQQKESVTKLSAEQSGEEELD